MPDIKQKCSTTSSGLPDASEGQSASVKSGSRPHNGAGSAHTGKVKDTLQIVSTVLSIAGGLGTLFVWCAATFYVGDVELVADRPYQNLNVDVFNEKGQATTYHVNKFQLMPGKYHIEVSADGQSKHTIDVDVHFNRTEEVNFCLGEGNKLEVSRESNAMKALSPSQAAADSATDGSRTVTTNGERDRSPAASKSDAPVTEFEHQNQLRSVGTPSSATNADRAEPAKPAIASGQNLKNAESTKAATSASTTDVVDTPSTEDRHRHWWQLWRKKTDQQTGG